MNVQVSLQRTCQMVVEVLNVDHSAVFLFDTEHKNVTLAAECPRVATQPFSSIPLPDLAAILDHLKGKTSMLVADVESHDSLGSLRDLLLGWRVCSTLLLPLSCGNQVIGLCSANAIRHRRGFLFEDIQRGEAFAAQALIGIKNLQLQTENNRTKARLEHVMDGAPSAIIEVDAKGNVTGWNDQAWQMLGYKGPNELPRDVRDLYYYSTEPYEIGKHLHVNGSLTNYETLARGNNGDPIPIRISVRHLLDEHHQRVLSIGNFQDLRVINDAEKRFDLLWKASDTPVDSKGLTNWFERLSAMLLSVFPHTFCQIALLDETQSFLTVKTSVAGAIDQKPFTWTPNTGCQIDVSRWLGLRDALHRGDPIHLHWSDRGSQGKLIGYSRQLRLEPDLQSLLVIPLKIGERPIGLFNLGDIRMEKEISFSREEINRVASLAPQIASLIDRAILAQKKAQLVEQLNRSNAAAQHIAAVSARGSLQATLQAVTEETCKALECDAITLYVHDTITKNISNPPKMFGVWNPEGLKRFNSLPENSIVWNILRRQEPYIVKDISEDSLLKGSRFAKEEDIRSCVAVSLTAAGQPVGVLFINYRTLHQFLPDELTTIKHFANQAAVAIYNAQLSEQARKKATALAALYETGRIVSGSLNPKEILRRVAEHAWELTQGYSENVRGSVDVWLVENHKAHPIAEYFEGPATLHRRVLDLKEKDSRKVGIIGRAARSGKSQFINDVSQDPDYRKHNPTTQSELAVPIKIHDTVVGVINIERPDINGFQPEDKHAVESLATQASIALQNAKQHEEISKTREQLAIKTAIGLMGIDKAELGHATLPEAITIRELVTLLSRDSYIKAATDQIKGWIERIDTIAARVQEKLGYISPSPEEGQQSVVVNDFVYKQLDQLKVSWRYRHETASAVELQQEFLLSGHYAVRANPQWLARVLNIIVDNALEAVAEIEKPVITIATKFMDGGVGILISDTGRGIPDDVLPSFFKKQVKSERGSKGLGMGVLLAQDIIQTYGGELRLGSTGPQGTTMIIWLPLDPLMSEESQDKEAISETATVLLVGDQRESKWVQAISDAVLPLGGIELVQEQEVLWHIEKKPYAVVLVDAQSVKNPSLLIEQIRIHNPHIKVVVAAESPKWKFAREIFRSGAADCISRSACPEELGSLLNRTLLQPFPHVELISRLSAHQNGYHSSAN